MKSPVDPLLGARPNVWIVDDSAIAGDLSRRALTKDHDVTLFREGAVMLEALASGPFPDVLVLDWHMPEMSGLDLCGFVRERADPNELPILFLTATGTEEHLLRGLGAGANDFVQKPCSEGELNVRVTGLVRNKRLHASLRNAHELLRAAHDTLSETNARLRETEDRLQVEAGFRERFIGILAHDLRQPLNTFLLGTQALAMYDSGRADQIAIAGQQNRAAQTMQRMVGDMLDFARSRPAEGMPIRRQAMDLAALVREVIGDARRAHPTRTIELTVSGDCHGSWDADRLEQICTNLVGNALEHSPATSTLEVALTRADGRVLLHVENQGTPIAPAVLATLFEPFRRGANARANGGLGLGLYIVDQIARSHAGRVDVTSDERATRFTVTLPCT